MTIMTFLLVDLSARRFTVRRHIQAQLIDPETPPALHGARKMPPSLPEESKDPTVGDANLLISDLGEPTQSNQDLAKNAAQLTGVFILEFGVVFHSVFVGLSLAVSGDEFITLYIVLVFHQFFEGLGLGTRIAVTMLPKMGLPVSYGFVALYALATPVAIAIGLAVRTSFEPGNPSSLVINGVLYSISAGILIYTSLVELIAHEFLFSGPLEGASNRTVAAAFSCMILGAGLMALLGKWA